MIVSINLRIYILDDANNGSCTFSGKKSFFWNSYYHVKETESDNIWGYCLDMDVPDEEKVAKKEKTFSYFNYLGKG